MSSRTFAGLRIKSLVAALLLVVLATSTLVNASSAETAPGDGPTARSRIAVPSAVSNATPLNRFGLGYSAASFFPGQWGQAPETANPVEAILGRARRYAVFHGVETGHPNQPWKFDKSYLWGDIGIGPGVRTEFGADTTVIGDCYQQTGQAAGKGCVDIQPHASSPPHAEPTYRDITGDLGPVVQDIRAAVTYVDGLAATQTFERITGGMAIVSLECGMVHVIRVNREVNLGGANQFMTIQGCPTDTFIFDVGGKWASSGGRVRLNGGVSAANILWVFKGRLDNSGNGGWVGTAIFDTPDGVDNAGKDLSCFDCALLVLNGKLSTSADSNLRWHPFSVFDYGDSPKRYGTLFDVANGVARHRYTPNGPRLGSAWSGETDGLPTFEANGDAGEDGVSILPLTQAFSTEPVMLTVMAINPSQSNAVATVACWIDFNRDDDFLDAGERASATLGYSATLSPVTLTFNGFQSPVPGPSYLRCRISTSDALASPITPIPPPAPTPSLTKPMFSLEKSSYQLNDGWPNGEVEDYKIIIEPLGDPAPDYGDAPDTGLGTGQGNYNTLIGDGGPRHYIEEGLYLGAQGPDLEFGTLQNADATADDLTTFDDEDGIVTLPAISAQSTSVQVSVRATNETDNDAKLRCWIDFNRNGAFTDLGEASNLSTVSATSGTNTYTLTLSGFAVPTPGASIIRCRIAHAPSDLAQVVAYSGEIEDYLVVIAP